jgi:hypothetical protein
MKYFGDGYRLGQAANLFEKLMVRTPEVAALLAKSYIGMSEFFCLQLGTSNMISQTRKSRPSRSSLRLSEIRPNPSLSFTSNAIFSVKKADTNGLFVWHNKLSTAPRASS